MTYLTVIVSESKREKVAFNPDHVIMIMVEPSVIDGECLVTVHGLAAKYLVVGTVQEVTGSLVGIRY